MNNKKKIIFLDFDGVLNNENTPVETLVNNMGTFSDGRGLDPNLVEKINFICSYFLNIEVWVHSSWRHIFTSEQILEILRNKGFSGNYGGCVDNVAPGYHRGEDIHNHLMLFGKDIESFVIIDDLSRFAFHPDEHSFLVQTDEYIGITDEDAMRCIKILEAC